MIFATHLLAGFEITTLPQQLVNGLLLGAIYALIALGYTMVYGVLKLINFAHGEVFMLGAYTALFVSWSLGYSPTSTNTNGSVIVLLLMILGSMLVCSLVGVIIERFAYRPMRGKARIASLITAIGVSLFLQYGGQLYLPVNPPPNISPSVNPFRRNIELHLKSPSSQLIAQAASMKPQMDAAKAALDADLPTEKSEFDLSPKGQALQDSYRELHRKYQAVLDKSEASALTITVPQGQLIMLVTTLVLMGIMTYLVMFTKPGRAMRAASHDFDSASLMGINVDRIITFTFVLGSSLAGAGAMMNATFLSGSKIDTFFGLAPGVKAFVAAVLGGIGNIPGAVLGGLLMGVAETLVVWAGYDAYRDAIAFVILIAVLLVRPSGLLGSNKVEKV